MVGRMGRYRRWARREEFRQFSNRYLASIGGTPIEVDPFETEEERRARRREETISWMVETFQKEWPRWSQEVRVKLSEMHPEVFARSGLSLDDPYEER